MSFGRTTSLGAKRVGSCRRGLVVSAALARYWDFRASGVSRFIDGLKHRLGVRLLNCTRLNLTSGGALYERAAPHLEGIEVAASHVSGAAVAVRGALRVSVNPIFARYISGTQIAAVTPASSGSETDGGAATRCRRSGDGGSMSQCALGATSSTITSKLLLNTRVLTVAAPAYLAQHGRPESPGSYRA